MMHLLFPASNFSPSVMFAVFAQLAFSVGTFAWIFSIQAFEKREPRRSLLLAVLTLLCYLPMNGVQINRWEWTLGSLPFMWLLRKVIIKTTQRYGSDSFAFLSMYMLGMLLLSLPLIVYGFHLSAHHKEPMHNQMLWYIVFCGAVCLAVGGIMHYRLSLLPPSLSQKTPNQMPEPNL